MEARGGQAALHSARCVLVLDRDTALHGVVAAA
jgi:hypothetical protein